MPPHTNKAFVGDIDPKFLTNVKKEEVEETTFDEALDIVGFGRMQIQTLLLCGLFLFAVIYETMGVGFVIPVAQCDLNLSSTDKGILSTISFLGIMMSSHLWGYLGDTKGRKTVMIYTLFISNLCSIASCFAQTFITFTIMRFLVGFFISAASSLTYAYLAEFMKPKIRPSIILWASCFVGVACALLPVFAYFILRMEWEAKFFGEYLFRPWRLLLLVYIIPGFISALLLIGFPESPKFLLSQGRTDEALEVFRLIHRINKGSKAEFTIKKLSLEENEGVPDALIGIKAMARSVWQQTVPLFKPPHLLYFVVCCILQFGVFAACGGMALWLPEILNRVYSGAIEDDKTICQILTDRVTPSAVVPYNTTADEFAEVAKVCNDTMQDSVFVGFFLLGILYTVAYVILSLIIKPVGRSIILASSLLSSGLAGLALQWVQDPIGFMMLFAAYVTLSGICISVINSAVVNIFPTHLRGMAVCLTLMIGRFGSVAASNTIGVLLETNCELTFYLAAGIILVCGTLSLILPR